MSMTSLSFLTNVRQLNDLNQGNLVLTTQKCQKSRIKNIFVGYFDIHCLYFV